MGNSNWQPENYEIEVIKTSLKRQCHEILRLMHYFDESNPPGPLINRLKGFCLIIIVTMYQNLPLALHGSA